MVRDFARILYRRLRDIFVNASDAVGMRRVGEVNDRFGDQMSAHPDDDDFFRWYGEDNASTTRIFGVVSRVFLPTFGAGIGDPDHNEHLDTGGIGIVNFGEFSSNYLTNLGTSRPLRAPFTSAELTRIDAPALRFESLVNALPRSGRRVSRRLSFAHLFGESLPPQGDGATDSDSAKNCMREPQRRCPLGESNSKARRGRSKILPGPEGPTLLREGGRNRWSMKTRPGRPSHAGITNSDSSDDSFETSEALSR